MKGDTDMKYIFAEKTSKGWILESKNYNTCETTPSREYIGFTKAEAVKDYKAEYQLKGYKVI